MTDFQLYLTVGMPSLAVLMGILVNVTMFNSLGSRMAAMEGRLDAKIDSVERRFDARMHSLEAKFDLLLGKVIEIDNRLTRVEERLKIS